MWRRTDCLGITRCPGPARREFVCFCVLECPALLTFVLLSQGSLAVARWEEFAHLSADESTRILHSYGGCAPTLKDPLPTKPAQATGRHLRPTADLRAGRPSWPVAMNEGRYNGARSSVMDPIPTRALFPRLRNKGMGSWPKCAGAGETNVGGRHLPHGRTGSKPPPGRGQSRRSRWRAWMVLQSYLWSDCEALGSN
jgi:hypothetical protein